MRSRLLRERAAAVVAASSAVRGGGGGTSVPIGIAGGGSGPPGASVTDIRGVSTRVLVDGGVVVAELDEATAEIDVADLAVVGIDVVVFPIVCV